MQRVMDGRRQVTVECPGCQAAVGLWVKTLTGDAADAFLASHPDVITVGTVEGEVSVSPAWVTCLVCGHDDHFSFELPNLPDGAGYTTWVDGFEPPRSLP